MTTTSPHPTTPARDLLLDRGMFAPERLAAASHEALELYQLALTVERLRRTHQRAGRPVPWTIPVVVDQLIAWAISIDTPATTHTTAAHADHQALAPTPSGPRLGHDDFTSASLAHLGAAFATLASVPAATRELDRVRHTGDLAEAAELLQAVVHQLTDTVTEARQALERARRPAATRAVARTLDTIRHGHHDHGSGGQQEGERR